MSDRPQHVRELPCIHLMPGCFYSVEREELWLDLGILMASPECPPRPADMDEMEYRTEVLLSVVSAVCETWPWLVVRRAKECSYSVCTPRSSGNHETEKVLLRLRGKGGPECN